ncbi:hypothetical protein J6A31_00925 [bacterium]|nr:hypothetical protein [bacterium]
MGLFDSFGSLASIYGMFTMARDYFTKVSKWLNETEMGKKVKDIATEKVSDIVDTVKDKMVSDYAADITAEEWNEVISANVESEELSALTGDDISKFSQLSAGFLSAVSSNNENGKWDNLIQSMTEKPLEWGVHLSDNGVTPELVAELQESGLGGYDMLKLSWKPKENEPIEEQTMDTPAIESLSVEELNDIVNGYVTNDNVLKLPRYDILQYSTLTDEFMSVLSNNNTDGKWNNLIQSMTNNSLQWGCHLLSNGVDGSVIVDMKMNGLSNYDMQQLLDTSIRDMDIIPSVSNIAEIVSKRETDQSSSVTDDRELPSVGTEPNVVDDLQEYNI